MNKNLTIGVFTKQLDNWTSGSGHHLNEMMKQILVMNTRLKFVFIHYKASKNPIYQQADEELIIPRNPFKAGAVLRKHHFDVIHFTPLTFFAPIWNTPGKKTATIHGVEQLLVPQFYGPIEMIHERFLVPIYARKMDHIITVSQASKDFFTGKYRVKEERVSICPNAVNEKYRVLPESEQGVPSGLSTMDGTPLRPEEKFIFHISRFSERKNPWTILKGFAEFTKKPVGKNYTLIIAGGRWDNPKVNDEVKRLELENRVVLAGFVDEEKAVSLYNSAAVFIFPSLAEGFGMPNIEAMACKCPVITSNIFAIPEVVGDAALIMKTAEDFHELADKIETLVIDEKLGEDLKVKGTGQAAKYRSWEPSARKMLDVFEKLAGL